MPIRGHQVLTTQHLLHESRTPFPGLLSRCRGRLTRSTGILGGSAAYLPGPLQLLSSLACVLCVPSNPLCRFGFSCSALRRRAPAATMASADFSLHPAGIAAQCRRRPFRRNARPPRVRRVTFAPSTRRIYVRSVRVAFGLQVFMPPRPPRGRLLCGSCSSGQSFAYGFLPASPREATVAVQLGVPSHRGPQGTLTPKSLPAWLSPHGYFPPIGGTRHAWRT